MNNNDDQSRIGKLEQQLYSREYTPEADKRTKITSEEVEGVQTGWNNSEPKEQTEKTKKAPKREGVFIKWVLIFSVLFFLASAVIAGFIFLQGGVNVSSRNVDVRILGPVSIGGGEELSLEIIVDNKNNVDMEAATVFVEYPDGTRSAENISNELVRDSQSYGPVGAGRNVRKTFNSVLFGEQDSVKNIKVVVEYRVRGSSATFEKEKNYEIKISSSPVLVDIDYPNEISSNQEVEFTIDVVSNSNSPLSNVVVQAEYPFGFAYTDSNPDPTYDTDIFVIGNLDPEEKVTLTISGVLQAQNNEERTFRFNVGTQSDTNEREIGATYVASTETIRVTSSSIGLTAQANGSSAQQVAARSGQSVNNVLSWFNNLPTRIVNARITASLSGSMIDRGSVSVTGGGFYRSSNDTISWDQNSLRTLEEIPPSGRGSVNFNFNVKELSSSLASSVRNPEITVVYDIEGTRFSEGNVPEQVRTQVEKTIRVASDFDLNSSIVRSVGPISNTGPIPPRVDQETTYTVIWSLSNSYNDVSGVRVSAQLPTYVEWDNAYSPSSEGLSYNPTNRQVTWEINALPAGSGFTTAPREVAFRVAVTPSLSQVGSSPIIIQQTSATAQDAFAGVTLSDTVDSLTTRLSTEGASQQDGRVVE